MWLILPVEPTLNITLSYITFLEIPAEIYTVGSRPVRLSRAVLSVPQPGRPDITCNYRKVQRTVYRLTACSDGHLVGDYITIFQPMMVKLEAGEPVFFKAFLRTSVPTARTVTLSTETRELDVQD